MSEWRAAIGPDMLDKELGSLSAAELIKCLNEPAVKRLNIGGVFSDKKKFELWVEEVPLQEIRLGDLIERLQLEKKKFELELDHFASIPTPQPDVMPVLVEGVAQALARRGFGS